MKLTQIDILKYKSIKEPVSIILNEGRVVTLIGKNGSGKTNVLEAIKYALSRNHYYQNEKIECKIKYHIELERDEIDNYFDHVQADKKSNEITVEFNGSNPEIRLIQAPMIECDVSNFKIRLDTVQQNFSIAAKKYLKALKNIESSDSYFGEYLDLQVEEDNQGHISRLQKYRIDNVEEIIKRQIEDIQKYISHLFKENNIVLNQYERHYSLAQQLWGIPFYRIPQDELIKISPIVASSLGITKSKLDSANEKLNNTLKEINQLLETEYQEMQKQLHEFEKIKKEISSIFDEKIDLQYKQDEELYQQFQSIVEQLKNLVFNNCYYIDNERSLLFYSANNREYRNEQIAQQYLNSRNPIIEAFDAFLHKKGVLNSNVSFTQKDKMTEQQIKKSISALNSEFLPMLVPNFDGGEIEKFSLDYNNGTLNLYVHEKTGDVVSFYDTSLGRRWYLTYQFVKALLKPGDMLFIDEPATFLHPHAQVEFKHELNKLTESGIYLFYSTHSPYMIPEDWGQVYNVVMTDRGTQLSKFETGDDLCKVIRQELGVTNAANILFNLEKTLLLVEGVADTVCIEKFAEVLHYDLSAYKILPCNGSPIFDVTYLCIQQGIKFKALFDLDNKSKPERWLNKKYGYNEYIKIFDTNTNCVFTPDIRKKKSLEDCFHENDNMRYFFDYIWTDKNEEEHATRKIDKDKVKAATDFEDETKNNFEQLFTKLGIPKLDEANS